jgi:hypothetical protein
MIEINLPQELEDWAKAQVANGLAPSVDALVEEVVSARKKDADWLDKMVKDALDSVEQHGWVDGETVLAELDQWIDELSLEVEELNAFKAQRKTA